MYSNEIQHADFAESSLWEAITCKSVCCDKYDTILSELFPKNEDSFHYIFFLDFIGMSCFATQYKGTLKRVYITENKKLTKCYVILLHGRTGWSNTILHLLVKYLTPKHSVTCLVCHNSISILNSIIKL